MKMATVDKAKDLIEKLHKASWGPAIKGEWDAYMIIRQAPFHDWFDTIL